MFNREIWISRWQLSKKNEAVYLKRREGMSSKPSCPLGCASRLCSCRLHLSCWFWLLLRPRDKSAGLVLADSTKLRFVWYCGSNAGRLWNTLVPLLTQQKRQIFEPLAFENLCEENWFGAGVHSASSAWVFKNECLLTSLTEKSHVL